MTHETHIICNKRIKQKGGQGECCYCSPHSHCEFKEKYWAGKWHDITCNFPEVDDAVCNCKRIYRKKKDESLCNFMILTPSPLHNGGMTCANLKPCWVHERKPLTKELVDECEKIAKEGRIALDNSCLCDFYIENKFCNHRVKHKGDSSDECKGCKEGYESEWHNQPPKQMAVEPSNWEKEFRRIIVDCDDLHIGKDINEPLKGDYYIDGYELEAFIRTQIQLESDKAYRRGQRDMKEGIMETLEEKYIQ